MISAYSAPLHDPAPRRGVVDLRPLTSLVTYDQTRPPAAVEKQHPAGPVQTLQATAESLQGNLKSCVNIEFAALRVSLVYQHLQISSLNVASATGLLHSKITESVVVINNTVFCLFDSLVRANSARRHESRCFKNCFQIHSLSSNHI